MSLSTTSTNQLFQILPTHNKATDEPRLREVFGAFGSVTDVFLPVSFTLYVFTI